ncbi:enoyl-CoA hydratase/isomerase family protein [Actinophytocola oryzae]|uniref:Enoyl-CoA hydratase n=1 Tax=Actinophytocola oryzae TaxID=502181 RepID=A0A4R7W104_9PSEU|nr:enoyl-CoA hydratase/isomerase family protein [Actinophytocola oryzae]TDV56216.1 enoyl-CoA hydratase [Actinophytocola oryzae]
MPVKGVEVERRGEVGWIILNDYQETVEAGFAEPEGYEPLQVGLLNALEEFRWDSGIRVIVITGKNDGAFYRVSRRPHYDVQKHADRLNPMHSPYMRQSMPASRSMTEILAFIEKPVIARMNGDAIGYGQALLWGCDMIVAWDGAVVADVHTGQGDVVDSDGEARGFPWAVTPGDGAMAFLPVSMTAAKLKEFMFLSRTWPVTKLAEMNLVNYAVPMDQLDGVLDEIIEKLLARPAHVLAHTKRVCNKRLVEQMNNVQDLASAYEMLNFVSHGVEGRMDMTK